MDPQRKVALAAKVVVARSALEGSEMLLRNLERQRADAIAAHNTAQVALTAARADTQSKAAAKERAQVLRQTTTSLT